MHGSCSMFCVPASAIIEWESYGVPVKCEMKLGVELDTLLLRLQEDRVDYKIIFR